jgi:hypothetical protein
VLVPFDLRTVDSGASPGGGAGAGEGEGYGGAGDLSQPRPGLITRLLQACRCFLVEAGNVREAAALCVSRLLSRPDMDRQHLRGYCDWAARALAVCCDAAAPPPFAGVAGGRRIGAGGADAAGGDVAVGRGAAGSSAGALPGAAASAAVAAAASAGIASEASFVLSVTRELGLPAGSVSAASRTFLATGVLQSLVEVAKHGHREALREVLGEVLSRVLAITGMTPDGEEGEEEEGGGAGSGSGRAPAGASAGGGLAALRASPLLRKLLVKLASRTALAYLPPRVVAWRYQRGQRSLLENLSLAGVAAAKAKALHLTAGAAVGEGGAGAGKSSAEAAAAAARVSTSTDTTAAAAASSTGVGSGGEDDTGEDVDVPVELEGVVDMLLQGLRDADTVVRWSAAKGVGRVTSRLPRAFGDDVVAAVMTLLAPAEGDGAWHGGCLALAELARRGLLLPSRLPEVVPRVLHALGYDVRRGAHSVGAHVRDAACYVCWAFARAYDPSVMRPHVLPLARGMLVTALFDREVNCRRAASAAFQENVGRQGHASFPDGIAILTLADYHALGNRGHAFTCVAPKVAAFPAYRTALLEHLLTVKLRHWDKAVRGLAAQALGRCVHLDLEWFKAVALPALLPQVTSPELFARHGAIAAIAEIVLAASQVPALLPASLLDPVRNVVVRAEKARAYTGRGGELVRAAMCRLIACQCLADHPLSRRAALRLLQTVDDCLKHPNDAIQASALEALRALAGHALSSPEPALLERLPVTYLTRLVSEENPAVRRGMALALGALPRSLLTARAPAPPGLAIPTLSDAAAAGAAAAAGGASPAAAQPPRSLLDAVIDGLIAASKQERQVIRRDAETRRNAVMGLADLVETVGVGERVAVRLTCAACGAAGGSGGGTAAAARPSHLCAPSASYATHLAVEEGAGLSEAQLARVWEALHAATHDYATDNRGDVGSWVRKAALEGLERVATCLQAAALAEARVSRLLAAAASGAADPGAAAAASAELAALATPSLARHAIDSLTDAAQSAGRVACRRGVGTRASGGVRAGPVGAAAAPAAPSAAGAVSGFNASITGYGAGTRLLSSAPHERPDALVTAGGLRLGSRVRCVYGVGVLSKVVGAGQVAEVDFTAAAACSSSGASGSDQLSGYASACFPYGTALLRANTLTPVHSARAGVGAAAAAAADEPCGCRRIVRLSEGGRGVLARFLTPDRSSGQLVGSLLRAACEKLDLLRGVAGEALCRVLHPPFPLPHLPHLAHAEALRAAFPPPPPSALSWLGAERLAGPADSGGSSSAAEGGLAAAAAAGLVPLVLLGGGVGPSSADDAAAGDEGLEEAEEAEEAEEDGRSVGSTDAAAAPSSPADADTSGGAAGGGDETTGGEAAGGCGVIQWSLPHHSFPRLVPLLGAGRPYVAPIVAGLVTAVGGLSESVVKQSGAALGAWAVAAARAGQLPLLHEVAAAVAALLRPRALQSWDVLVEGPAGGGAGGAAGPGYYTVGAVGQGGHDPSMSRWFKEILGAAAGGGVGSGAGASSKGSGSAASGAPSKLEVRLVTPALRTLDLLLRSGALDCLAPPAYPTFILDALAAAAKRAHAARDDSARVLAACEVHLAALHLPPPVRRAALCGVLDVLGHPFPRLRRGAAERLYVRLLTLEDGSLPLRETAEDGGGAGADADAAPADAGSAAAATAAAGVAAEAASLEAALACLTDTPWDAPVRQVLPARDRLYGLLGLRVPARRSGTDPAIFAGTSAEAGGHAAEGAFSFAQRAGSGAPGGGGDGGEDAGGYGALVREMGF